jgi:hypothetical protein
VKGGESPKGVEKTWAALSFRKGVDGRPPWKLREKVPEPPINPVSAAGISITMSYIILVETIC